MEIKKAQKVISKTYFERDAGRGLSKTFLWFVEEVGELAKALRKGDKKSLKEEFADVLAWLLSVAEITGVDMEEAFVEKYGRGCPACSSSPCTCAPRLFAFGEER
ncbi:MAG: nucleotide pyrophosphohydrolase [Planctomycetota bacterium]|nr:nucleotide pyrophosphohydrolase [Planctomycetota bacterium]